MFRISNNPQRGSSYPPRNNSSLDQQTQSNLESLEQLIRVPLQDLSLEEINQNPENFLSSCSGAREYLNKLRQEAKDSKGLQTKVDPQPSPLCKNLLGVLKIFVEESLTEILNKWEALLNRSDMKYEEAGPLVQVTLLGLEILRSVIMIVQGALMKKQKVWDEMTKLSSVFRSLNEVVLSKPSLVLLGESQMICGDSEQSEVILMLDRIYKAVWSLTFLLKKQNQLTDISDNLLNTLEIGFIQLIESEDGAYNMLGHELLTTMLYLTDNDYYLSLVNVVSNWHKKYPLNNVGKLYQILFLAANEATRERILWEVEKLEPEELYKFMQIFDSKMFEGYFEPLAQDDQTIIPKPSLLLEKMGLTPKLASKLKEIMNKKVCDDLLKTTQGLKNKNNNQYQQLQKRFISLMKIASISVNSSLFFIDSNNLGKIHEALIQIIEDIFTNSNPSEIHYVQLQAIIDVFFGMFKGFNSDQFEMIIDTISKSNNMACEMFAAKLGNILPYVNYEGQNTSQAKLVEKLGSLYHSMLQNDDALVRFKAGEGIMLAANKATVEPEELAVIIPPNDEGKELLRKIGTEDQDNKITKEIADEMLSNMGGRLASVLERHKISVDKFMSIQKDYGFDIGNNGLGKDEELDSAFKKIEEFILKLKEGETQPQNEYKKLQLRNKVNGLLDMCDPSNV